MDRPLVLANAAVWTPGWAAPRRVVVEIRDGRIAHVGEPGDARRVADAPETIDCEGGLLVPGFEDAHAHLMGLAARRGQVDCTIAVAPDIAAIVQRIGAAAATALPGAWVRAFGYDEGLLPERRHVRADDLDRAAPRNPVRLEHRTGHATVLNSMALSFLGAGTGAHNPAGGSFLRDAAGRATGVIVEAREWLSSALPPEARSEASDTALSRLSDDLLALGVTTVQDASPGNDVATLERFRALAGAGKLKQRIVLMPGAAHLDELAKAGLRYGGGWGRVLTGHVKVVLTLSTGAPSPSLEELREVVHRAVAAGFPVAVHAVERDATVLALEALREFPPPAGTRHRIEHASECPPWLARQIAQDGVGVATQPGFIHEAGDKYLRETAAELVPWLYPLRQLLDAGVAVAAGSDGPVASPDPLHGIRAAVSRRTRSGAVVAGDQALTPAEALSLYTRSPATLGPAGGSGPPRGQIAPGFAADLVLLDRDILEGGESLAAARVAMTVAEGRVTRAVRRGQARPATP